MTALPQKPAVVLLNLGGPLQPADIRPFLFNFFMDRNILPLPLPLRWLLARWIAWSRARGAARKSYGLLGGGSPLLENTQAQALALEKSLREKIPGARVFVSMRYWRPLSSETAREVAAFAPDKVVLLPLYPQFSTATTFSSLQDWRAAAAKAGLSAETEEICCYPEQEGFIAAAAALIQPLLAAAPTGTRLLFSAHGLPERNINQGDPYQHQCEATAAAIVRRLGIPGLDWQLCYQSRFGRLPWIGPSIGAALEKAAHDGVGVVVCPAAFVSEHVETLVELDIEYRRRALALGIPHYARVPAVATHPLFIAGLRDLALGALAGAKGARACPARFSKCRKGAQK